MNHLGTLGYVELESPKRRFVIFGTPNNVNIRTYIENIIETGPKATVWIRSCDQYYEEQNLTASGVHPYTLEFPDGEGPGKKILKLWRKILESYPGETIALHCVAGLGRSPLLAGIAMIEDGMTPLEVLTIIRGKIPGALNLPQVKYLVNYKKHRECLLL